MFWNYDAKPFNKKLEDQYADQKNKFPLGVNWLSAALYFASHNNPSFCFRSAYKERGQQRGCLNHLRF